MLIRSEFRLKGVRRGAFTLLELLVVIAIIGILAGLLMTGFGAAGKTKARARIDVQLAEIQTAIDEYHAKRGSFPPSNPKNIEHPTLYYELVGAVFDKPSREYRTSDGKTKIAAAKVKLLFDVDGFQNAGLTVEEVQNFYSNLKENSWFQDEEGRALLGSPVKSSEGNNLRWRYNSFNPTNNPGRYDLWVEWAQTQGAQADIIGNWKK